MFLTRGLAYTLATRCLTSDWLWREADARLEALYFFAVESRIADLIAGQHWLMLFLVFSRVLPT